MKRVVKPADQDFIQLRMVVSKEDKKRIKHAAIYADKTLRKFVAEAAINAAKAVLEEHNKKFQQLCDKA